MKKYLIITISFIIAGYLLLVLSMLISPELMKENVMISAKELANDGDYPGAFLEGAFVENFCDADYIAVAYNQRTDNIFYNALDAYNYSYNVNSGADRGVRGLYETLFGNPTRIYEHSHGWHGYRIFLRPLLTKYAISNIRWIFVFISFSLVVCICMLMYKATGKILACIPFLFAYLYFNYQIESLSLVISINLMLMLFPCVFVLYGCIKEKELSYFDLVMYLTGLSSAYFALCDLPTLSIGFPIIIMITFNRKQFNKTNRVLSLVGFWGLGYGIEGGLKFLINALFLKLDGAGYALKWYTGMVLNTGNTERFSKVGMLAQKAFLSEQAKTNILWIGIFIVIVRIIIWKKYKFLHVREFIPYIFLAFIPVLWILIMTIASNISWTVFIFSISIFAVLQYLWDVAFVREDDNGYYT